MLTWQAEAAREKFAARAAAAAAAATAKGSGRIWGPPPPPQHAAMLRGKLATAVLSGAVGRTIVAEVCDHPQKQKDS